MGIVFGAIARSESRKVETAAANNDAFDPGVQRLGKAAQSLQWVGYLLGGAAAAAAVILYASGPHGTPEEAAPPAPRISLAPLLGRGAGGALLRLTY